MPSFVSCSSRSMRHGARILLVAVTVGLANAPTAAGHASFLEATPDAGQRVERSPDRLSLAFTEPVNARLTRVALVDQRSGETIASRRERTAGRYVTLRPLRSLGRGPYRVRWRAVSSVDGHVREGYFSFGVGTAVSAAQELVAEGPLARSGWIRVAARLGLYLSLLVFAGGLLLRVLLPARRRGPWLSVSAAEFGDAPQHDAAALRREARTLTLAGGAAVGFAITMALAEGARAVGSLSGAVVTDFLLANTAGLTRLAVAFLVAGALVLLRLRSTVPAALLAASALAAIAASGHAATASPPSVAMLSAWLHLLAGAIWLGGIVLIVVAWGPALGRLGAAGRRALVTHVLPRFGRVALPAFLLVLATGALNSIMELGTIAALWTTAYGRVLLAKIVVVLLMAAVSLLHARVLRPRLARPGRRADAAAERRHWRLLRGEPLLGAAAVVAVAFLVGFPTPPRELEAAADADAKARDCSPCPLPDPRPGELPVAGWTGQEIVAGWIRPSRRGLEGEVRIYERSKAGAAPSERRISVVEAQQRPCGVGCVEFSTRERPRGLRVAVAGRREVVLPARWRAGRDEEARTLLRTAFSRLRNAPSVRLEERVNGVGGTAGRVSYLLQAPDRMTYRTAAGAEFVFAGRWQWFRQPDMPVWQKLPVGVRFRTRNWLRSPIFVRGERLLAVERDGSRRLAVVSYMDSGTPGWGVARIDMESRRVERVEMIVENNFIRHRYSAYGRPVDIDVPGENARD